MVAEKTKTDLKERSSSARAEDGCAKKKKKTQFLKKKIGNYERK